MIDRNGAILNQIIGLFGHAQVGCEVNEQTRKFLQENREQVQAKGRDKGVSEEVT